MFGPKMHVTEAPLAGAMIGGLVAGGGTLAGMATVAGMAGMALGAIGGTLLGKSMSPKMPKAQDQSQAAAAQTPALPPATEMPAAPATPVATPIPTAGEGSTPTAEELAAGQINTEKKRKGRLSTILSTPKSRLESTTTDGGGMERLGG